jgi:hypothetical protein
MNCALPGTDVGFTTIELLGRKQPHPDRTGAGGIRNKQPVAFDRRSRLDRRRRPRSMNAHGDT